MKNVCVFLYVSYGRLVYLMIIIIEEDSLDLNSELLMLLVICYGHQIRCTIRPTSFSVWNSIQRAGLLSAALETG